MLQDLRLPVSSRRLGLLVLFLAVCTAATGCASKVKLNKQEDYYKATNHLLSNRPVEALIALPETESTGFIQLSEKSWLSLIAGEPLPSAELKKMGKKLPTKETVIVSDEVSHYFYQRTPEGYFPAEHEVIFFHIMNAMVFMRGQNFEAAEVEARKAAFFLQDDYVTHAGGFDSAHLRVWLAAVWAGLGEWNKAQVDLRNAAKQSKQFAWAAELAKRQSAPKHLSLVLQGTGPEPKHDPKGLDQHLTGKGSVNFKEESLGKVYFSENGKLNEAPDQPTALAHYERHLDRNDQIREVLGQSDYMMTSSLVYTGGALAKTGAVAAAGTMIATGVVIGASLIAGTIYLLAQSGSSGEGTGEIAALGFTLGLGAMKLGWDAGTDVATTVNKSVNESTKETLDLARTYRFVRYLPSKVHLSWGEKPVEVSVESRKSFIDEGATGAGGMPVKQVAVDNEKKRLEPFLIARPQGSTVQFLYSSL